MTCNKSALPGVNAEVASEQQRILRWFASELAERHTYTPALQAARSAAIAEVHEAGNPVVDDRPDAQPGFYLVVGHTSAWLPQSHRSDSTDI